MAIFYFSYIYVFIFVSIVRPHLFYGSGSVTSATLAFSCAKLWQPCQMPSTRRGLLIWLKLSWKPSANNSYLGIPEKFLPNSLAF